MPNIQVQTRTITGNVVSTTSENAAYARTNERISRLENTAVFTTDTAVISPSMLNTDTLSLISGNRVFDNTTSTGGFWGQVKNLDFPNKTICKLLESQSTTHITSTSETVPFFVTQRKIHYEHDGLPEEEYEDNDGYIQTRPKAELFTRVASEYHEIIGDGYCIAGRDSSTPNFTGFAVSCYNKFRGNVGMTGITARMDEKAFTDTELHITDNTNGWGSSKSCAVFASIIRRSNYNQGRHGGSYSIGMESFMINSPTEDGADGTDGYFPNPKGASWKTWTAAIHTVCGGRRPVSAGIFMNGYSTSCKTSEANAADRKSFILRNGNLNGIIIGASSMAVRGGVPIKDAHGNYITRTVIKGGVEVEELVTTSGNSTETVGINTSSWSKSEGKNYGFYLLKHGYSGRILHSRGSALFEAPAFKFLNPNGSMPVAISCVDTYTYKDDNNQTQTAHGTPYLDFKIGSDSDFYNNSIPLERPTDTTRARIGYLSSTNSLNVSSDGAIKLITSRNFADSEAETLDFTMSNNGFYPSAMANLGSQNYFWDNAFVRKGAINIADSEKYRDTSSVVRPSTAGDTEVEKLLTAWGNVGYKLFKFTDAGSKKHIGLSAQDISDAFTAQGLTANSYGLYWANTNGNTTDYGVRYNECLAMECAYLRDQLDSVKARLTALENT